MYFKNIIISFSTRREKSEQTLLSSKQSPEYFVLTTCCIRKLKKLKDTSCSFSFSAMYFLAASVASFTCVSRAAWDAIPFASWVRRVTIRLNTLVKKHSEQHSNSAQIIKTTQQNTKQPLFAHSALVVKTKPQEDRWRTWRKTSRLNDNSKIRDWKDFHPSKTWFLMQNLSPPKNLQPLRGQRLACLKAETLSHDLVL